MTVLLLTHVIPERNEKFEVIGVNKFPLYLNPDWVQSIGLDLSRDERGARVHLKGGADWQVLETPEEAADKWERAMGWK